MLKIKKTACKVYEFYWLFSYYYFIPFLVAIALIISVKQAHTKRRADGQTDMAKSLLMLLQNLYSFIRKCLLMSGGL